MSKAALFGLQFASLWPTWLWLTRRFGDGSDEPWGVLALGAVAALVWRDRARLREPSTGARLVAGALTVAAAFATGWLPPILVAAIALAAVGILVGALLPACRPRTAMVLLALMVLPVVASLNFYLGYPLRWLCALGAASLIRLAGVAVTPEGTALVWNGRSVLVDAPCAGIAMLWVGIFAALLFSYLNGAKGLRLAANLSVAAAAVVCANAVRNAILFFKEAELVWWPAWSHEVVGLSVFALAIYPIYRFASLRRSPC